MALNREEAAALFTSMVASVRGHRANLQLGVPQPDRYSLARERWYRYVRSPRANFNDYVSVAARAIQAVEAGDHLHTPGSPALRRANIPRNAGIRANQPEFEYRVVVTGLTPGSTRNQGPEGLIIVRSQDIMALNEIIDRAQFVLTHAGYGHDYRNRVPTLQNVPQVTYRVVAVSRFEPLR